MSEPTAHSLHLQRLLEQVRKGDRAARDGLFRGVCARMELLARTMLKDFPGVRRRAEVEDVVQNALVRLLHALEAVRPESVQHFFNLAAVHLRRELVDLARQVNGRRAKEVRRVAVRDEDDSGDSAIEPAAPTEDAAEIDNWGSFHRHVERLPVEEREVVSLIYYHGWTQAEVADLFQVTERTVRRRWESALGKLRRFLKER
jgi:RNA polymerase sigma factor (sigma-70 family)